MTDLFLRIKRKRSKVRPGRLRGKALEQLRRDCFERDGYMCQANLRYEPGVPEFFDGFWYRCGCPVIWERGFPNSGHMAHIVSRGRGGKDELSNVVTKCPECHMVTEHSYGKSGVKPCKAKERRA